MKKIEKLKNIRNSLVNDINIRTFNFDNNLSKTILNLIQNKEGISYIQTNYYLEDKDSSKNPINNNLSPDNETINKAKDLWNSYLNKYTSKNNENIHKMIVSYKDAEIFDKYTSYQGVSKENLFNYFWNKKFVILGDTITPEMFQLAFPYVTEYLNTLINWKIAHQKNDIPTDTMNLISQRFINNQSYQYKIKH